MAIKKIGEYDLIFCGRQAGDWDAGQVGLGIAEILGLPSVTVVRKIDITDGKAKVERVTADGYEVIEVALPAVITVTSELGGASGSFICLTQTIIFIACLPFVYSLLFNEVKTS
ncbi:Protein FixA [subsurface metagenome]